MLASMASASDLSQWEVDQTPLSSFEANSPEESSPGSAEPGLSSRAVPMLPDCPSQSSFRRFTSCRIFRTFRRSAPSRCPIIPILPHFRPVTVNLPPLGLHPRIYRNGLFELYPWFGLSQSFESNVNLVSVNPVSDLYITPRLGAEFQLGTPDSVYNEFYDTILAIHGHYEAWADLFFQHPQFSAFNQEVQLSGRIGRSAAIWRPSFNYSDITGSNLLQSELINRVRRLRTAANLLGQYQFTGQLGANQTFAYNQLEHPEPGYINLSVYRTLQELTWKVRESFFTTTWAEYRYSDPSLGSSGSEAIAGFGFYGKPDPRLFTELRIGYDSVNLQGYVPGRRNMSGLRFNGGTTFSWSSRLALTLLYDRGYAFNEQTPNDNYVSTLLQVKAEIFMGGNWYLVPYFGSSIQQYELSGGETFQWRPELELAYALPGGGISQPGFQYAGGSKIFLKLGYLSSLPIIGNYDSVQDWRLSVGFNCKF